jgi:hypothetical protein
MAGQDWRSDAERRLVDRRCRCGRLVTAAAPGCQWHEAVAAEYARDLAGELAQLRCPVTVTWLDLGGVDSDGLVVRCVLPAGHAGDHRDGTRWWDHAGFQIPRDSEPVGGSRKEAR